MDEAKIKAIEEITIASDKRTIREIHVARTLAERIGHSASAVGIVGEAVAFDWEQGSREYRVFVFEIGDNEDDNPAG
jgi:hypothetical protein